MNDKTTVELIDFWPDGYVGHTDSNGVDVGKNFLRSIPSNLENIHGKDIRIYSHFYTQRKSEKIKKYIESLKSVVDRDALNVRRKLHGHNTKTFKLSSDSLNIWYTSENLRPPLNEEFDLFLSHDTDLYDGRNVYLPIWATRLGSSLLNGDMAQSAMIANRKSSESDRKGICAVISNPEPIRMAFIREVQKYFDVDIYGAFGLPIIEKDNVLRSYKLNICFENDEFPGYVTEKPFEAWMNGCIPVWRGLDSGGYLNDEAIINVTRDGFSDSIGRIHSILNDDSEYLRLSGLPILQKKYDYDDFKSRIQSALYT